MLLIFLLISKRTLSTVLHRRISGHVFITIKLNLLGSNKSPILIQLIDLAASDCQHNHTSTDDYRGGIFVRKSLASLGAVLHGVVKLQTNPSTPISFRESSLTRLLKRVLCSNSHAVLIANVCPSSASYLNSLQTLTFASRLLRYRHHAGTSPFQRKRVSLNAEPGLKIHSPEEFLNKVQRVNRSEAKQSLLKTMVADPRQRLSRILAKKVHKSYSQPHNLSLRSEALPSNWNNSVNSSSIVSIENDDTYIKIAARDSNVSNKHLRFGYCNGSVLILYTTSGEGWCS